MSRLRLLWPSPLERRIAIRYLRGRKASRLTALNSKIATAGVAIGVASMLVVLGVMSGLQEELRDRILVGNPHIHIYEPGEVIRLHDWRSALDTVRLDPDVVSASPEVYVKTLMINRERLAEFVQILGVDTDTSATAATSIGDSLVAGDLRFAPTQPDSVDGAVVIGKGLAKKLAVDVGDVIFVVDHPSNVGRRNAATGAFMPGLVRLEVTGIFHTGMYLYDDQFAVMPVAAAQQLDRLGDAVSGLQVRIKDPWRADEVAVRLRERLAHIPAVAYTWQAQNQPLFSALKLEKLGMGLIIAFVTLVAAFNIVGTLNMIVGEKTREIGILRAVGLTRPAVRRVFFAQGAIIGLGGTVIGLVLGLTVAFALDRTRLLSIQPEVYFIDHLPVRIGVIDVVAVVTTSLVIAFAATLPTSLWASRLEPVEAIRHE